MCGIVGLFCKSPDLEPRLGEYLAAMLEQMSDRGPDSAGVAVYRDPAPSGSSKLTLYSFDPAMSWDALCGELAETFGGAHEAGVRANHAVLVVEGEAAEVEDWIRRHRPDLRVMSAGRVIEIYKEVGRPQAFVEQFHLGDIELADLDGFYTFLVGTADGFAVLRDPIACKPAVLAETDDWVAMSSEYRAIAVLPGASHARLWEPEPAVVYAWEKALV